MAPAASEQALIGFTHGCSPGPVFVATETRISPFENSSGNNSSGTFHHDPSDWHALHSRPNLQTTIASAYLESPSPSPATTDWEQLLNPLGGDGFELPLWSTKVGAGDGFALVHESPLAKQVDDAHTPAPQPQLLEAVEGTTTATATMDGVIVAAAAPHENTCTTSAKASPPRSPHHHGVELASTNSRKRKKGRSSSDPGKRGEEEECVTDSKTGKRSQKGREPSFSETSGESAGASKKEIHHHHHDRHHPRDPEERHPLKTEFSKQDYIHVRARRGQATDSHSLAERVRREKMSERMKFLQDLVPGCRKVTGKAVMLDEIINYVQCLQRQVESLSMKLASVSLAQSSSHHWTLESLLSNKDILQAQLFSSNGAAGAFAMQQRRRMPPPLQPATAAAGPQQQLPFSFDFRGSSSSGSLGSSRCLATLSAPNFADFTTTSMRPLHTTGHQFTGRENELQSAVRMGLHQQEQLGSFASQLQCSQLPAGRMKVEF